MKFSKYLFLIIFFSSFSFLNAETPYFLDFKSILNQSEAGKKAQSFLKTKLESGIKSINEKQTKIQDFRLLQVMLANGFNQFQLFQMILL